MPFSPNIDAVSGDFTMAMRVRMLSDDASQARRLDSSFTFLVGERYLFWSGSSQVPSQDTMRLKKTKKEKNCSHLPILLDIDRTVVIAASATATAAVAVPP
jgi:hypothetical protein